MRREDFIKGAKVRVIDSVNTYSNFRESIGMEGIITQNFEDIQYGIILFGNRFCVNYTLDNLELVELPTNHYIIY